MAALINENYKWVAVMSEFRSDCLYMDVLEYVFLP